MKISPAHPLHLVLGLIIWSTWFVTVYVSVTMACNKSVKSLYAFKPNLINFSLILMTTVIGFSLLALAVWCWKNRGQSLFMPQVSAGLYFFSACATFLVSTPLLYLPPCL